MQAPEINLTPRQITVAYNQLNRRNRRAFLKTVLTQPANQQIAIELLAEVHEILGRKLSDEQQRLLDKLLDASTERQLRPTEQKKLDQLTAAYGQDLVEKAQARYLFELSRRAGQSIR